MSRKGLIGSRFLDFSDRFCMRHAEKKKVEVEFRPLISPSAIIALNMITLLYYHLLQVSKYNKKCNVKDFL